MVRLDGTNDKEGRALLAEANLPNVHTEATMLGAAEKVVELAALMAILVDRDTRWSSPDNGPRGHFHRLRNRDYGTNVVAGVTPGKGGQDVDGVPSSTRSTRRLKKHSQTRRWCSCRRDSRPTILEAEDAGIPLIITITEGIPAHDELRIYTHLLRGGSRLVGPNCPASSPRARRTWGSSRRSSSRRATSASCRARAR